MSETSKTSASLLQRLREAPEEKDWDRFLDQYTKFIRDWLDRRGVRGHDADDVAQDVFVKVCAKISTFHYDSDGSFRGWLYLIIRDCLKKFWQTRRPHVHGQGGSDFRDLVQQMEDPASGLSRQWARDHDTFIVRQLLELIKPEFKPKTWQAFMRIEFEDHDPEKVATELGMTVNAIYIAKSRIKRRLREKGDGLID